MSEWYYSDKEERRGPISLEMLQRLVQNGLVAPDELAWTEGMSDWKPISSIRELRSPQSGSTYDARPNDRPLFENDRPRFDPDRDVSRRRDEGYERDSYDESRRSSYNKAPHRGTMILVLGLLGVLLCGFLAIPAFFMGKSDLDAIKSGRMDPSGEGLTRAGYILGIIGVVLMVLQLGMFCLAFGLAAAGK